MSRSTGWRRFSVVTETLAALQTDKSQLEIRAIRDRGLAGFLKRRKPFPL